jgi:hypothetical protein
MPNSPKRDLKNKNDDGINQPRKAQTSNVPANSTPTGNEQSSSDPSHESEASISTSIFKLTAPIPRQLALGILVGFFIGILFSGGVFFAYQDTLNKPFINFVAAQTLASIYTTPVIQSQLTSTLLIPTPQPLNTSTSTVSLSQEVATSAPSISLPQQLSTPVIDVTIRNNGIELTPSPDLIFINETTEIFITIDPDGSNHVTCSGWSVDPPPASGTLPSGCNLTFLPVPNQITKVNVNVTTTNGVTVLKQFQFSP